MRRSIALVDQSHGLTSTIQLPPHARPDSCARILASAMILANLRGWHVVTTGFEGRVTLAAFRLVDACEHPRAKAA